MKTKLFNTLKGSVVTAALLITLPALASMTPHVESLKKSLSTVPVLEMPAKAAQMVSESKADDQETVALSVVLAAAQLKPAAIAPVVGAIVRTAPELAPAIAAAAAGQLPNQAGAIVKAAVGAAPSQAGKIVRAVCSQVPKKYEEVAMAALQAAPAAGREISEALTIAVPAQKISQELQVSMLAPMQVSLAAPVVGPPFTAAPGSPTEISQANTIVVQPGGGRSYASP